MQWVRTGRPARVIAVFFLLWTGIDLVNPNLCGSDQQTGPRSALTQSVVISGGSSQATRNGDTEDCFCCCHHLVSTTMWVLIPQVDVSRRLVVPPVEQVRVFRTRLDRPPQLV